MTSYLNNDYDVMNYFAKFEKFLAHSISIPSFMTVRSQMSESDWGALPPYKLGSQNTPYEPGLKSKPSRCFLVLSLLEPLMQSNLDVNLLGDCDITSDFGSPG